MSRPNLVLHSLAVCYAISFPYGLDYTHFLGLSSRVHIKLFCAKIPISTFKCLWELELLGEELEQSSKELEGENYACNKPKKEYDKDNDDQFHLGVPLGP